MEKMNTEKLFKVEEICDLWQSFCSRHTELFEITCDEYILLLESDLDSLETLIVKKAELIEDIKTLEERRQFLLLNLDESPLSTLSDLLDFLEQNQLEGQKTRIEKLNLLLVDVITKIQDQNKKNQIYLNKAMTALRDLKDKFAGKKPYRTYGADGSVNV